MSLPGEHTGSAEVAERVLRDRFTRVFDLFLAIGVERSRPRWVIALGLSRDVPISNAHVSCFEEVGEQPANRTVG